MEKTHTPTDTKQSKADKNLGKAIWAWFKRLNWSKILQILLLLILPLFLLNIFIILNISILR
jgi:hypothetical protein